MNRETCIKYIIRFVLLSLFVVFIHNDGQSQFWKRKLNQSDEKGLKTGVWKNHWDEEKTILMSRYKYKESECVGISKTYHSNGRRSTRFKYYKDGRSKEKHFDLDGRLEVKGPAIMRVEGKYLHYYWHGEWKYYNAAHQLLAIKLYEYGEIKKVIWERKEDS